MDKGHIYILQYIKNLEDQVLADNYVVGKEIVRDKPIVESLIDWLFHAKSLNEIKGADFNDVYAGYKILEKGIPDQKYGLEWMKSYGKNQNNGGFIKKTAQEINNCNI